MWDNEATLSESFCLFFFKKGFPISLHIGIFTHQQEEWKCHEHR